MRLQVRKVGDDLHLGRAARKHIENIGNPDASTCDNGAPAANSAVDRYIREICERHIGMIGFGDAWVKRLRSLTAPVAFRHQTATNRPVTRLARSLAALFALAATGPCVGQYAPPAHNRPPPPGISRSSPAEIVEQSDGGTQIERDRPVGYALAEHRRLQRALAAVGPQRNGTVDAYIVTVALDSDPVFGREAREAAKVLARRYNAGGRTLVLAGSDGSAASDLAMGSPHNITAALARVAELMNRDEDVLVLYTTSHGAPFGIVYNDGNEGYGAISPRRLASLLGDLGIKRRVLLISACYSGVFVQPLASPDTAIVTAASAETSSFGCFADNDWTFFGDALINHALRKPTKFAPAVEEARQEIAGWEARDKLEPSRPSLMIGGNVDSWLGPLEARIPATATKPVGRPAAEALAELDRLRQRK